MNVLKDKDVLVLHVASYLYAMERTQLKVQTKTSQQHMELFIERYLEFKEEPQANSRWTAWPSIVRRHVTLAESMLDLNKFDEHVLDKYFIS
jgi:hypothetical protein